MDRTAFEAALREQGYGEMVDRRIEANSVNPEQRNVPAIVQAIARGRDN